jgi:hypothetical protein
MIKSLFSDLNAYLFDLSSFQNNLYKFIVFNLLIFIEENRELNKKFKV